MSERQPFITIIVPCYNEEATIQRLLEALWIQTYPKNRMELIVSDGLSVDHTRQIISRYQAAHPDISLRLIDNPQRTIPSALNKAISLARGEIIVRLDAHSIPIPEYVEGCVAALLAGRGDNVGGVWEIRPGANSWIARSIAAAAANPLGAGDALYRLKPAAGAVDTVPFGSFRKELLARIGPFDESLLTNEDYELNTRIRLAGGKVWLDPSIRAVYFSRPTLFQLASQYGRYGYWKWRMLIRYPQSLRWRQALPPLLVLSLILLSVLSLWINLARVGLSILLFSYLLILGLAGLRVSIHQRSLIFLPGLPLAITTMHLSWGAGFLWSMIAGWLVLPKNG